MGAANYIFLLLGAERLKRLVTTALLSSYRVYIFAYEVGIVSSYSNSICCRKNAKSRTKDA